MNKYAMTLAKQMLSARDVRPVSPDKSDRIRDMISGRTAHMERWLPKQAAYSKAICVGDEHKIKMAGIIKKAEEIWAQGNRPYYYGGNMGFLTSLINALRNWWGTTGVQSSQQRRQAWINNRTKQLQDRIKNPNAYETGKWGVGDYVQAALNPLGAAYQTMRNKVFGDNRNRTQMGRGDYALFVGSPYLGLANMGRVKLNKWVADARNWNYNRQMNNAATRAQDEASKLQF